MNAIVEQALSLWGLGRADYTLLAARENSVFKVTANNTMYALRLHRKDYRSDAELRSELRWMDAVSVGGLSVSAPVPSTSGKLMHVVDGIQVDILAWVPGDTLDVILPNADGQSRLRLFYQLGRNMARLHMVSDDWQSPEGFVRCAWDSDGLVGKSPLWGKFWENSGLGTHDRNLLLSFRDRAYADLTSQAAMLDYGLIHADLVGANVMAHGTDLHFIDFDDGGYGFRVFEIATALLKHVHASDYGALKLALTDGYASVRPICLSTLSLFMALRAVTYVGWNITRMNEDGGSSRNERFIKTATSLTEAYLRNTPTKVAVTTERGEQCSFI